MTLTASASQRQRRAPKNKAPQRTCVVCRTARDKPDLVRLTKSPDAALIVDQRARTPGRGAYLCRRHACWTDDTTPEQLTRALRRPLSDQDRATLHDFAHTIATAEPESNSQ